MKTKEVKRKEALERLQASVWENSKQYKIATARAAEGQVVDFAVVKAAWEGRKQAALDYLSA